MAKDNVLTVFTDGACRGNPGRGGYGFILQWGEVKKEFAAGFRRTTNNRMELMAVVAALEKMNREGVAIEIYSDSKYVVEAVEQRWLEGWLRNGFRGGKIKNQDLWRRYAALAQKHRITFHWVKGHADNPMNNRCDVLATGAADGKELGIDEGYEAGAAADSVQEMGL